MNIIKFEDWETDLDRGHAMHNSGLSLRIEGDPRDPSAVTPINFSSLSFGDQARLLREGLAALAAAASSRANFTPSVKTTSQRTAKARAKLFAERPERPRRPTLSLNR